MTENSQLTIENKDNTQKNRLETLRTFCINAPLILAKQHLFCCVVFPVLSGMIGGSAGQALHTESAELAAGIVATPLVTFGVMAFEQWRHDRKKHHCDHDHKILTAKKFFLQAAIGYGVFFSAHALLDNDHNSKKNPPPSYKTTQIHAQPK
jgi:hypothetical protein